MSSSRGILLCIIMTMAIVGLFAEGISNTETAQDVTVPQIALVTILPGTSLYSAFGHTALRVINPRTGDDSLYNYGLSARSFDVSFLLNMLGGKMEFMVGKLSTNQSYTFYSQIENRSIIEQRLYLDRASTEMLLQQLELDIQKDRCYYNYRYFTENCATRVWKLLEPYLTIPSALIVQKTTIREELSKALGDRIWLKLIINTMLGPVADRTEEGFARYFLPIQLNNFITSAYKVSATAELIAPSTKVIYRQVLKAKKNFFSLIFVLSVILLLTILTFCNHKHISTYVDIFDITLFVFSTIIFLTIFCLWVLAGYEEIGWNINLLWANPIPLMILVSRSRKLRVGQARVIILGGYAFITLILALIGGGDFQLIPIELRLVAFILSARCTHRTLMMYIDRSNTRS